MNVFARALQNNVRRTCINRKSCPKEMQMNCYYKNNLYHPDISIDSRHPKCLMLVDIFKWHTILAPTAIISICFGVYLFLESSVEPVIALEDFDKVTEIIEIIEIVQDSTRQQAIISEDFFSIPFTSKILEERYPEIAEIAFVAPLRRVYVEMPISYKERRMYSPEEIFALEKIVQAEAGGEPYLGKLCVANVVLNRQEKFGGSIIDIIFAGNQFTPTHDGSYEIAYPSADVQEAVRAALAGNDNSNGSLYFMNEATSTSQWAARNREFSHIISNHSFFK